MWFYNICNWKGDGRDLRPSLYVRSCKAAMHKRSGPRYRCRHGTRLFYRCDWLTALWTCRRRSRAYESLTHYTASNISRNPISLSAGEVVNQYIPLPFRLPFSSEGYTFFRLMTKIRPRSSTVGFCIEASPTRITRR